MTKVTAVLLIIWYSMSIIGFGVHTCSGSGQSFVVSFIEGLSCEDIHPEHHCSKGKCCSHTHGCCENDNVLSFEPKSCCSSDYQVLTLTGTISDDKNVIADLLLSALSSCIRAAVFGPDMYCPITITHKYAPDSSPGGVPDIQSALSVWRI